MVTMLFLFTHSAGHKRTYLAMPNKMPIFTFFIYLFSHILQPYHSFSYLFSSKSLPHTSPLPNLLLFSLFSEKERLHNDHQTRYIKVPIRLGSYSHTEERLGNQYEEKDPNSSQKSQRQPLLSLLKILQDH